MHLTETCKKALPFGRAGTAQAVTERVRFPVKRLFPRGAPEAFSSDTGNGLWHPAAASALERALHPAGHCPNSSSLFPPLAAVVAVAGYSIARPIAALRQQGPAPADGPQRSFLRSSAAASKKAQPSIPTAVPFQITFYAFSYPCGISFFLSRSIRVRRASLALIPSLTMAFTVWTMGIST